MPIILPPDPPAPAGAVGTPPGDPAPALDTVAADRLFARLAPLATYDQPNGDVVARIAETLAHRQAVVDDVCRDTGTHLAWQPALDPDTCPADWLPWLAQFAGVQLLPSDTEADQRQRIKTAAGFHRGTSRSMVEEVALTLTGSQHVSYLTSVGSDPWAQTVITRTSETPDSSLTAKRALAQKPAGVVLTVITSDSPIIDEGTRTIDASTGTVDTATVADVT